MFELSVAAKYLIPHRRQLSVSIISLVSTLVIALVVWLIVVFFSVKEGLENGWINKIVALTAPIRITPTSEYYNSTYYLIDSLSETSQYKNKSIGEKYQTLTTNPYNADTDEELPSFWQAPVLNSDGSMKDLVKGLYDSIYKSGTRLNVNDYESAAARLHLTLIRPLNNYPTDSTNETSYTEQHLEHSSLLGPISDNNPTLASMLQAPSMKDVENTQQTAKYNHLKDVTSSLIATPSSDGTSIKMNDTQLGHALLLPQSFKESGLLIGDQGYLSYDALTSSSVQEQRIPVYVAGFYDPGIMPIGNKYLLANPELVRAVHSAIDSDQALMSNGVNVRFKNLDEAKNIKQRIVKELHDKNIAQFWHVQTYQEYEFAKDLIQQLQSEKNLFTIISLIIIIVACSNIISMLIILVNDKKLEIGILRSMGASSFSIAAIFGLCGVTMGAAGSIMGTCAALLTLRYINELVGFITALQGHELFNPVFYGSMLPSEISLESLSLVIIATAGISLIAGIIPAIKASTLRPSSILRAE